MDNFYGLHMCIIPNSVLLIRFFGTWLSVKFRGIFSSLIKFSQIPHFFILLYTFLLYTFYFIRFTFYFILPFTLFYFQVVCCSPSCCTFMLHFFLESFSNYFQSSYTWYLIKDSPYSQSTVLGWSEDRK